MRAAMSAGMDPLSQLDLARVTGGGGKPFDLHVPGYGMVYGRPGETAAQVRARAIALAPRGTYIPNAQPRF